jgi:hypothetical protein
LAADSTVGLLLKMEERAAVSWLISLYLSCGFLTFYYFLTKNFIAEASNMIRKVEIHFMREGLILNLKSNSADILRWDMRVMFAHSYVLQLSNNVKRSKEQAVKSGSWIGLSPLGYLHVLDQQGEKTIILDPDRAPFIVKLFEMYATGNYSLLKLAEEAEKLRT